GEDRPEAGVSGAFPWDHAWHVRCSVPRSMANLFSNVDVARYALDYHMQRHNVLASNVANVDTPGFRPQELVREVDRGFAGTLRVQQTREGHLQPPGVGSAGLEEARTERVIQPGADGNAVSLEREMAKVAANNLRFETASRIVRQQLALLRYAASDGNT
ncbi:MAG: flagellar basal body rod protein FlgB, partial [Myxococcales bacterium]|nr:flagellar basal body rod protein FlgB [Myxococcales bacterium]